MSRIEALRERLRALAVEERLAAVRTRSVDQVDTMPRELLDSRADPRPGVHSVDIPALQNLTLTQVSTTLAAVLWSDRDRNEAYKALSHHFWPKITTLITEHYTTWGQQFHGLVALCAFVYSTVYTGFDVEPVLDQDPAALSSFQRVGDEPTTPGADEEREVPRILRETKLVDLINSTYRNDDNGFWEATKVLMIPFNDMTTYYTFMMVALLMWNREDELAFFNLARLYPNNRNVRLGGAPSVPTGIGPIDTLQLPNGTVPAQPAQIISDNVLTYSVDIRDSSPGKGYKREVTANTVFSPSRLSDRSARELILFVSQFVERRLVRPIA